MTLLKSVAFALAVACGTSALAQAPLNTLTEEEKSQGWRLLWDGRTTDGWRSAKSEEFPKQGWAIQDGVLTVLESGGGESKAGGDIITRERFSRFELKFEFKLTPGANSGVKYFAQTHLGPVSKTGEKMAVGSAIGLEFQVLDDARHPDAKKGRDANRTIGSLYDLIAAAADKKVHPIGEWNSGHVVAVDGKHIEHRLNGQQVVTYERGSEDFRNLVAVSKFQKIAGFGEWADGHILLQDHGNTVSYRNIKIRVP